MRGARHDDAVRVARDDLRAHLPQVVDEVEARLEHLLEEEARAACLRGEDDQDRQEIRRERRPRPVGDGRNRVAEVVFHLETLPLRNVAERPRLRVNRPRHAEAGIRLLQNLERLRVDVLQGDLAPRDGGGGEVAARLDVVAADARAGSVERGDAANDDAVGPRALDVRPHRAEEVREVDDVRLARRVENDGLARRERGGHEDVLRRRHRGLVEEDPGAAEFASEREGFLSRNRVRPQGAEALEMRVEAAVADGVAPRRRQDGATEPRQERPCEEEGCADFRRQLGLDPRRLETRGAERDRPRLQVA